MWDVTKVTVAALLLATFVNALLIPATPGTEIRGLGEMYPLNGPSWSLFFEYIGNILYALIIRKFSTKALAVLVVAAGCGLAAFSIFGPYGDICCRVFVDRDGVYGRIFSFAVRFLRRVLLSLRFQAGPCQGGILEVQPARDYSAGRSAPGREPIACG